MTVVFLVKKEPEGSPVYGEYNTCKSIASKIGNAVVAKTGETLPKDTSKVFRWGCTANVANGKKGLILNKARAIHLAANKSQFRGVLRDKYPNIIPKTWLDTDPLSEIMDSVKDVPLVVRPSKHSRGANFHYCTKVEEVISALNITGPGSYISKFYQKKKEFRVMFIQGRVVWMFEKIPNNPKLHCWGLSATWNKISWGDWPLVAVDYAHKAFTESGLDFGAVDIIQDVKDNFYVCEVNSAPEFDLNYKEDRAAKVFKHMIDNNYAPTLPVTGNSNWRNFLHPVLDERAV